MATARALCCALCLAAVSVAGCTEVRLVSDYDPQTDEALSAIHQDIESILTELERTLGTPAGDAEEYAERYDRVRVDLRTLAVRAAARPLNTIQVDQLAQVLTQLDLFASAHREGMQAAEIPPFRRGFDQSFGAMIRLELAKRRGDGGD